jgi:hypothetical protein
MVRIKFTYPHFSSHFQANVPSAAWPRIGGGCTVENSLRFARFSTIGLLNADDPINKVRPVSLSEFL